MAEQTGNLMIASQSEGTSPTFGIARHRIC